MDFSSFVIDDRILFFLRVNMFGKEFIHFDLFGLSAGMFSMFIWLVVLDKGFDGRMSSDLRLIGGISGTGGRGFGSTG